MNSIRLKGWGREAGQNTEVGEILHSGGDDGEPRENISDAIPVPDWEHAIHRRTDQIATLWSLATLYRDLLDEGLNCGINTDGDGRRSVVGVGQEVGEAGHHANVGLRTNLGQALWQQLTTSAKDYLCSLEKRTSRSVGGIHMLLHVGISDEGEDQGRHLY